MKQFNMEKLSMMGISRLVPNSLSLWLSISIFACKFAILILAINFSKHSFRHFTFAIINLSSRIPIFAHSSSQGSQTTPSGQASIQIKVTALGRHFIICFLKGSITPLLVKLKKLPGCNAEK